MLATIVSYLVQLLIVGPFETQLNDRLAAARAPAALISQVQACATAAIPALVQRIGEDPWQAVSLTGSIWLGRTQPEDVVIATTPACQPAIENARRYLTRPQG